MWPWRRNKNSEKGINLPKSAWQEQSKEYFQHLILSRGTNYSVYRAKYFLENCRRSYYALIFVSSITEGFLKKKYFN